MVRALPVPFYDVTPNRNYDAVFSPSEPVYFVYEFPAKDVETVHLKVTSMDDVCFTVSIQPHIVIHIKNQQKLILNNIIFLVSYIWPSGSYNLSG